MKAANAYRFQAAMIASPGQPDSSQEIGPGVENLS
jgi:hypothetical protein